MLNKMGIHTSFPATRVPFILGHSDVFGAPGIDPTSQHCACKTSPHDLLSRIPLRSGGGNGWKFRSNRRNTSIESQFALNAGLNATFGQ